MPAALAAAILAEVSSGHFTCTKCTSAGEPMPASAMAARTAAAVASICAPRPISCGRKSRVWAMPSTSRLPGRAWAASTCRRVKTVKWGESTPSVPPDITRATR